MHIGLLRIFQYLAGLFKVVHFYDLRIEVIFDIMHNNSYCYNDTYRITIIGLLGCDAM
jgi:hypothetical protein